MKKQNLSEINETMEKIQNDLFNTFDYDQKRRWGDLRRRFDLVDPRAFRKVDDKLKETLSMAYAQRIRGGMDDDMLISVVNNVMDKVLLATVVDVADKKRVDFNTITKVLVDLQDHKFCSPAIIADENEVQNLKAALHELQGELLERYGDPAQKGTVLSQQDVAELKKVLTYNDVRLAQNFVRSLAGSLHIGTYGTKSAQSGGTAAGNVTGYTRTIASKVEEIKAAMEMQNARKAELQRKIDANTAAVESNYRYMEEIAADTSRGREFERLYEANVQLKNDVNIWQQSLANCDNAYAGLGRIISLVDNLLSATGDPGVIKKLENELRSANINEPKSVNNLVKVLDAMQHPVEGPEIVKLRQAQKITDKAAESTITNPAAEALRKKMLEEQQQRAQANIDIATMGSSDAAPAEKDKPKKF